MAQLQQVTWWVEDGGNDTGEEPEEHKMTAASYIEFTVRVNPSGGFLYNEFIITLQLTKLNKSQVAVATSLAITYET